ncbi:MAG: hypothetical protein R2814_14875 [Flavobacteriaceae bacterium]
MFKRTLNLIVIAFTVFACSNDETTAIPAGLWIKVNNIPEVEGNTYRLSDLNLKIYNSPEDYVNGENAIYSGKVTADGEMKITAGIEKEVVYYIDIYSDDHNISNWSECISLADNITSNCGVKSRSNEMSGIPLDIYLYRGRRHFVNNWNFSHYSYMNDTDGRSIERTSLKIKKDLTVEAMENIEGTNYKVLFKISTISDNQCSLEFVSATPSENYNYNGILGENVIEMTLTDLGFLSLRFPYEWADYLPEQIDDINGD